MEEKKKRTKKGKKTMSNDVNVQKLNEIIQLATEVRNDLAGSNPSTEIPVPVGTSIQSAIDSNPAGSVLVLGNGVYSENLTINKPVTIKTNYTGDANSMMPTILNGNSDATITINNQDTSGYVTLQGFAVKNDNYNGDMIDIYGKQVNIDHVAVLGQPTNGAHRGILTNGQVIKIVNSYVDDIFLPDRDTQAIGGWDGTDTLTIDKCFLCAAGETIMFGGADASSETRMPKNVKVTNCHLTKKREWFGHTQIKNAFELKAITNFTMQDCLLEYAGISEGQQGYLIVLTVRNQEGTAPWSTIQNVLIERVNARYAGACISFLGSDDSAASVEMENVTIRNVNFTDIDPAGITGGGGNCVAFNRSCKKVTLDSLSIAGGNLNSLGYFPEQGQQPTGLTMSNWKFPQTTYGWKIDGGGMDVPPDATNLKLYMPDLVYAITANDAGASGFPSFK